MNGFLHFGHFGLNRPALGFGIVDDVSQWGHVKFTGILYWNSLLDSQEDWDSQEETEAWSEI